MSTLILGRKIWGIKKPKKGSKKRGKLKKNCAGFGSYTYY